MSPASATAGRYPHLDRLDPAQRRTAVVLVATGLDIHDRPGGLRDPAIDIARDVAQALGLIPTVPARPRKVPLTEDRPARRRA